MNEPNAEDHLKGLLGGLNSSAERLQTLWFSFLTLTVYLSVVALTITHRMLLLKEAQVLPIVGLKVPLLPFFVIAPLLYVVVHFYTLMMLVLLARTAATFENELKYVFPIRSDQERFRAQVQNALFLQLLAGMQSEREGRNSWFLSAIAFATLAVAPVILMLLMQLQFLPYHHLGMTWWHRILVVSDALAVILLWSAYRSGGGEILSKRSFASKPLAFAVVLITFVGYSALYAGRWTGERWIGRSDDGVSPEIFGAPVGFRIFGVFPDHLIIRNQSIVDASLLKQKVAEKNAGEVRQSVWTYDLSERDLNHADFSGSDLRLVNLEAAWLERAVLSRTQLNGANLAKVHMDGVIAEQSELAGANLSSAKLDGANFASATFDSAQMPFVTSRGSNFAGSRMRGVSVIFANMDGSLFDYADLQLSVFGGGSLEASSFFETGLQAARFNGSDMRAARFQRDYMYRTRILDSNLVVSSSTKRLLADAVFSKIRFESVKRDSLMPNDVPITVDDVEDWYDSAIAGVQNSNAIKAKKEWANELLPGRDLNLKSEAVDLQSMINFLNSLPIDELGNQKAQATILADLACNAGNGPHVARGLMKWRFESLGEQLDGVKARLKKARTDRVTCPGVLEFKDNDWQKLEEMLPVDRDDN
jgi:uncharacterized protein YjbI with pentapeptide repeats